jgi:8-oxo-dGTP diphosphatase
MPQRKPHIAVGAIVIRDGSMLMVRRGQDPGRGLWSLPGGRVEKGEYLDEAVTREVREETGVEVTPSALIGILEVVGDPHYVILDYAAAVSGNGDPIAAGDADEARWVPLEQIDTLECTPRFVETLTSWGVLQPKDQQT